MRKEVELIAATSCLNSAAPDEPVFVLRANDELAPQAVRYWAYRYYMTKMQAGGMTEKQSAKYREALKLADEMEDWKNEHNRK